MNSSETMPAMIKALQRYFGYSSFIPPQGEIISSILEGNDIFALLPTGGGKSLCYQLPSLLLKGTILVISPLIALMKDQVDGLRQRGIEASYINSMLSPHEIRQIQSSLLEGRTRILYVAPERLMIPEFLSLLNRLDIGLVAVDEAHCISEWGHDFRPAYRQLCNIREWIPGAPIIALTATATSEVQDDIISLLRLKDPHVFRSSFNRSNLVYSVKPKNRAFDQLSEYLEGHRGQCGIIYCFSQKSTEDLAGKLQEKGFNACHYHAGMDPWTRESAQDRFLKGEIEIMVATIAFGMGIDKPDIRFVIHYDMPKNLETYCQETGRAGRDGKKSDCILFFTRGDLVKLDRLLDRGEDQAQVLVARRKLRQMAEFCESRSCRRKVLLEYFGEPFKKPSCEGCDNCLSPKETSDGTDEARKIASCVSQVGERFGVRYIAEILHGSRNHRIIQNGHDALPAYGSGKEHSVTQWSSFIRELIQLGYLRTEGDDYPVVKLTDRCHDTLSRGCEVQLTKPGSGKTDRKDSLAREPNIDDDADVELFQALRELRKSLADREMVPPYIVFHDTSLKEMASRLPRDRLQMMSISGVGKKKMEKYGDLFLKEIRDHCVRKCIGGCAESESDEGTAMGGTNVSSLVTPVPDDAEMPQAATELEDWFQDYNWWSIARHELWQSCRRAYFYEYIAPALKSRGDCHWDELKALKDLSSKASLKGKLVHQVIEYQINNLASGEGMSEDDAVDQYARLVRDIQENPLSHITEYFNGLKVESSFFDDILVSGQDQIRIFFARAVPQILGSSYISHERFNSFVVGNAKVAVKLHYLGTRQDGRLLILDWKTGPDSLSQSDEVLMACYILWAIHSLGTRLENICCRVVYLGSGKIREPKFTQERLDELKGIIEGSFNEMNRSYDMESLPPDPEPEKCQRCQFYTICSYSRAKTRQFQAGPGPELGPLSSRTEEACFNEEDGGSLLWKASAIKEQIDRLRDQIHELEIEYDHCLKTANELQTVRKGRHNPG